MSRTQKIGTRRTCLGKYLVKKVAQGRYKHKIKSAYLLRMFNKITSKAGSVPNKIKLKSTWNGFIKYTRTQRFLPQVHKFYVVLGPHPRARSHDELAEIK